MKGKEINKPVTLIRAELISNLTNTINNSSLPAFVIEPILKDLLSEVRAVAQKQLEEDRKNYFAALEDANKETDSASEDNDK